MGVKKIRNFMEIPKIGSKLSDKMHLKGVISKKQQIFGLCHVFEENIAVFWK